MIDQLIVERFRADGHAVVRGLAPRGDIDGYRPVIERAVRDVAQWKDP